MNFDRSHRDFSRNPATCLLKYPGGNNPHESLRENQGPPELRSRAQPVDLRLSSGGFRAEDQFRQACSARPITDFAQILRRLPRFALAASPLPVHRGRRDHESFPPCKPTSLNIALDALCCIWSARCAIIACAGTGRASGASSAPEPERRKRPRRVSKRGLRLAGDLRGAQIAWCMASWREARIPHASLARPWRSTIPGLFLKEFRPGVDVGGENKFAFRLCGRDPGRERVIGRRD